MPSVVVPRAGRCRARRCAMSPAMRRFQAGDVIGRQRGDLERWIGERRRSHAFSCPCEVAICAVVSAAAGSRSARKLRRGHRRQLFAGQRGTWAVTSRATRRGHRGQRGGSGPPAGRWSGWTWAVVRAARVGVKAHVLRREARSARCAARPVTSPSRDLVGAQAGIWRGRGLELRRAQPGKRRCPAQRDRRGQAGLVGRVRPLGRAQCGHLAVASARGSGRAQP